VDKCVLVTGTAERVCDHMVCAFLCLWDLGCLETSGQLGAIRHDHHDSSRLERVEPNRELWCSHPKHALNDPFHSKAGANKVVSVVWVRVGLPQQRSVVSKYAFQPSLQFESCQYLASTKRR
jgi:hypothetical protein